MSGLKSRGLRAGIIPGLNSCRLVLVIGFKF
ncbi:hypothetical protein F383_38311 [Gossypium arboreum]|uniref:Uncharacterized protein n=1 Tax=Gossypium arboreum TaxID=29729 RepID=A0A0B0MF26_GOSAR|nr:hypothetical protein F383_38311 [Gossypium arboreum]